MAKGGPDLKRYMDKNLLLKLNGNRTVKVSSGATSSARGARINSAQGFEIATTSSLFKKI